MLDQTKLDTLLRTLLSDDLDLVPVACLTLQARLRDLWTEWLSGLVSLFPRKIIYLSTLRLMVHSHRVRDLGVQVSDQVTLVEALDLWDSVKVTK